MLSTLELELLGFDHRTPSVLRRYHDRFPDDASATSLDNWQRFEEEFPGVFTRGYIFWATRA
jgi:hypothetical protein